MYPRSRSSANYHPDGAKMVMPSKHAPLLRVSLGSVEPCARSRSPSPAPGHPPTTQRTGWSPSGPQLRALPTPGAEGLDMREAR